MPKVFLLILKFEIFIVVCVLSLCNYIISWFLLVWFQLSILTETSKFA